MSKNKKWSSPGWPWELDLLSLIFVAVALIVPFMYFEAAGSNEVTRALREQHHTLWAIGIVVLFVVQLAIGGATLELISTPILHLVAPPIFAALAYYRSITVLQEANIPSALGGTVLHYALVVAAAIALTLAAARIRTVRFLRRFRDVQWDIVQKAPYDDTYWSLIPEFQPLVYPPRCYRACSEGILIEGLFYAMAIPFEMFQSLSPAAGLRHATNGRYMASSRRSIIRIELLDNAEPLFISPADRQSFLAYCAAQVSRLRPISSAKATHAGSARGTHAGTVRGTRGATAHGTRHGTSRGTHSGPTTNIGSGPAVPVQDNNKSRT